MTVRELIELLTWGAVFVSLIAAGVFIGIKVAGVAL